MATNFPNSPSNGATHTFGGTTYTYNSSKGVWKASADAIAVGDNPPSNPETGALWFDSSVAKTYIYYNDGSSSQWVQLNPSGGSDGADGQNATGGGESPIIYTEPATSHVLNTDGSTSTVQMQAVDPEGTAITYGIAYANATNARPSQLASDTTINQSTGTFTFDPSTNNSDAGSFKVRLSASDGVQTSTRFVNFTLSFNHEIDYLLIAGGGQGGSNFGGGGGAGGVLYGSTTLAADGSTYNFTIGAGGTGGSNQGADGADSTFNSLTAVGGGGGGYYSAGTAGSAGGSGGGGGSSESGGTQHAGGAGTSGQGNAGSYGIGRNGYLGGGGGGAGSAGGTLTANSTSGAGGDGITWPSGSSNRYAGGGSGGAYTHSNNTQPGAVDTASGAGQGSGASGGTGGHATANTGSGGGGGGYPGGTGGNGGSGILVIHSNIAFASHTGTLTTVSGAAKPYVYTFTSSGNFVVNS